MLKKRKLDANIPIETLKTKAQNQIVNYLQLVMCKVISQGQVEEDNEGQVLNKQISSLIEQLKS